jgi:hypothetical protein
MKVLDVIAIALSLVILAGTPIVAGSWLVCFYSRRSAIGPAAERANHRLRFVTKCLKAVLVLIAAFFVICFFSVLVAREEVLRGVSSPRDTYAISVNGQPMEDPGGLLLALRELRWTLGHHSHTAQSVDLKIAGQTQSVTLNVARDSENPQEYWVFVPRYWITSRIDIGRVTTSALDRYLAPGRRAN